MLSGGAEFAISCEGECVSSSTGLDASWWMSFDSVSSNFCGSSLCLVEVGGVDTNSTM